MFTQQSLKRLQTWDCNKGFTLIEVMIAMVIFVVGMLSVAAMQTNATRGNITANRTTRSFIWCSDRTEVLKSLPYTALLTDPSLIGAPDPGITYPLVQDADGVDNDYDGQIDEAGETGNINIRYTVIDDAVLLNTKTITVRANWQTPLGEQKSFTLRTVRARNTTAN